MLSINAHIMNNAMFDYLQHTQLVTIVIVTYLQL